MLKNSWLFPIVQSIHLAGLALFVGTIMIRNVRELGLLQRETPSGLTASGLERELTPWIGAGMATMLITGPLLFAADAERYLNNPAFLVKMLLLCLALALQFKFLPQSGKAPAAVSTAMWTLVVLAARAIADFDIS